MSIVINGSGSISGATTLTDEATIDGLTVGQGAGNVATNTAVGKNALDANTTGGSNTAIGQDALGANTTASGNTAVGYQAGYSNTTSNYQCFVGYQAGYAATGNGNTIVGHQAGYQLTTGTRNTFVGVGGSNNWVGGAMTTGSKNTIIGGYSGNQGGLDIRTSSNNIVLSDGDGNPRVHIDSSGNVGVNTPNPTANLDVGTGTINADGLTMTYNYAGAGFWLRNTHSIGKIAQFRGTGGGDAGDISITGTFSCAFNTSSDYRLKENVVPMSGATERLKQLKPSRFNFIADPDKTVDGFLAHEVSDIVPEAITGEKDAVDADGNPEYQGIDQSKLVPLLVATIQELEARIAALESN